MLGRVSKRIFSWDDAVELVKFSRDFMAVWGRVSASHEPALVKEVVVGKDMVGM